MVAFGAGGVLVLHGQAGRMEELPWSQLRFHLPSP